LAVPSAHAEIPIKFAPCRQDRVLGWVAALPITLDVCPRPSSAWQLRSFPLPGAKRTLCSYEWRSDQSPNKDSLPRGLIYSPDCMAIGVDMKERPFEPQDDHPATEADIAAIQDDFLDALDAPALAAPQPAAIPEQYPTLAFIDALPVQAEVPQDGALQHGNSLATLAKLLRGCDDESCRFRPGWFGEPALFPYERGDVVGSPLDAADAVRGALQHFRDSASEHLVLSIGLGFEADGRCAALPDSFVVSALREAIRRAACQADAIILAPVGNKRDDDVSDGMLYPAAFEQEELVCNGVPQGRSLVAAISGVDLRLRALGGSRANAPLMTFGGPWAYEGNGPHEQLNPRTASSVAVAAAGPIISLAWWLRPDLDAKALLAALASAGTASRPALAGSRVIKACATLANLCSDDQLGRCAELPELCPNTPAVAALESPLQAAPAFVPRAASASEPEPTYCIGRGQRIEPSGPGE
jgi:hypothetical protein